jgi:uncharacterized protein YdeI (YjbR/CyaY-like superfamily)
VNANALGRVSAPPAAQLILRQTLLVHAEPVRAFASQAEWEAWLDEHHAASSGIWIKVAKKGSGAESITIPEALEVALCYGWIDSQRKPLDERFFLQRYSPRTRRSRWSRINREKAEQLIEAGRMKPAGLDTIEAARTDGRWDASTD